MRSDIDVRTRSQLPHWEAFAPAAEKTQPLRDTLQRQGFNGILAASPVRFLRCDIGGQSDYLQFIEARAKRAVAALTRAASAIDDTAQVLSDSAPVWSELLEVTIAARRLVPLAEAGALSILDANEPSARRAQKLLKKIDRLEATALQAQSNARGWNTEAELDEVSQLLDSATRKECKFLAFLNGGWRRAKAFVKTNYSGDANSATQALSLLHRRLTSLAKHEDGKEALRAELKLSEHDSIDECRTLLDEAWNDKADLSPAQRDLLTLAGEQPKAGRTILQLSGHASVVGRADNELAGLLVDYHNETPARLQVLVQTLSDNADACDDYVDDLAALTDIDPTVLSALRNVDQPFEVLSIAVLDETIRTRLRKVRKASKFDAQALQRALDSLSALANEGHDLNGRWAINVGSEIFHAHLARASESMSNTSQQEKDWRRAYMRGCKTLEREFEKTRAYRSVRELFASESGPVLRDLRPVWLMSPLSVADALPLSETLFDVVIFDEASQIPLEDAIPTINRANQRLVLSHSRRPNSRKSKQRYNAWQTMTATFATSWSWRKNESKTINLLACS